MWVLSERSLSRFVGHLLVASSFPNNSGRLEIDGFRMAYSWQLEYLLISFVSWSPQLLEFWNPARQCDGVRNFVWDAEKHHAAKMMGWNPGCRAEDGEGKPVLDENGEERRGVEAVKHAGQGSVRMQIVPGCFVKLGSKRSVVSRILVFVCTWKKCQNAIHVLVPFEQCFVNTQTIVMASVCKSCQGLFTLDNRRLYVLQRAAVYHYPRCGWDDQLRQLKIAESLAGNVRSASKSSLIAGRFFIICVPGLLVT